MNGKTPRDITPTKARQLDKDTYIKQLLESNQQLIKILEKKNQELTAPTEEVTNLKSDIEKFRLHIENLLKQIEQNVFESQMRALLEQNQQLMKDYNDLLEENLSNQKLKDNPHQAYYKNHQIVMSIYRDRVAQLESLMEGSKMQIDYFTKQLNKERQQNKTFQSQFNQMKNEYSGMKSQTESDRQTLRRNKHLLDESAHFQEQMKGEIVSLQQTNENLKRDYAEMLNLYMQKEAVIEDFSQNITKVEQTLRELNDALAQQILENNQLQTLNEQLVLEKDILTADLQSALVRNQKLQDTLIVFESEIPQ